jgi:hypothetical protein
MANRHLIPKDQRKASLRIRGILLLVQIALPFGLYLALRWESRPVALMMAGLYALSMIYLVWLG